MRKTTLFIPMSLDGYIADAKGGADWLNGQDPDAVAEDFYAEFIKTADTVLMGWNTFDQIVRELSPDEWPYSGLSTYVFTHRTLPDSKDIHFTKEDPCTLLKRLKQGEGKDIWICGGARLIEGIVQEEAINPFWITVIPVLLGGGIRLFPTLKAPQELALVHVRHSNGMVDLLYRKR